MSWFSRSMSGRGRDVEEEEESREGEDGEGNVSGSPTGKGVREDLSELRKTFTRQLWGVASFLAPPAVEKCDDGSEEEELANEERREVETAVTTSARRDDDAGCGRDGEGVFGEAGKDESDGRKSGSRGVGEQLWGPDNGLLGIRSDFAELTGSLSSGLSRFSSSVIRAVAGEDFEGHSKSLSPASPRSQSGDSEHSVKHVGFNSLLKPLFGNILAREKDARGDEVEEFEPWGTENDEAQPSEDIRPEPKASTQDAFPTALATGISEISKLASSFLPFSLEPYSKVSSSSDDKLLAVGLTPEVIAFASNIAMHPETWLDFPLAGDEDADDFHLSLEQDEHINALELEAPSLAALRIEMCPGYMSEARFWKIYFVLLQSRLNKEDSELLCTPQIVEARKHLLDEVLRTEGRSQELQPEDEDAERERMDGWLEDNSKVMQEHSQDTDAELKITYTESSSKPDDTTAQQAKSTDFLTLDASIQIKDTPDQKQGAFPSLHLDDEGDAEEWLDEDQLTGEAGLGGNADEEVSFSDLEDDDSNVVSLPTVAGSRPGQVEGQESSLTSASGRNAEQASNSAIENSGAAAKPERLESDDWLTVDEEDLASADSS